MARCTWCGVMSIGSGLVGTESRPTALETEEAADAVEAVRVGIGTSMGSGEPAPPPPEEVDDTEDGEGDDDGDVTCCLVYSGVCG